MYTFSTLQRLDMYTFSNATRHVHPLAMQLDMYTLSTACQHVVTTMVYSPYCSISSTFVIPTITSVQTCSAYSTTCRYSIDNRFNRNRHPVQGPPSRPDFWQKVGRRRRGWDGPGSMHRPAPLFFQPTFGEKSGRDGGPWTGWSQSLTLFHAHLYTMHMASDQCSYYPIVLGYVEPMYSHGHVFELDMYTSSITTPHIHL